MKTNRQAGSITITALIFTLIGAAMVAAYLSYSSQDMRLTRMNIELQQATMIAEAGLDHGVMRLRDIVLAYQLSPLVSRSELDARVGAISAPPGVGAYQYRTPQGDPAFRVEVLTDVIHGTLTNGTYRGYNGSYQVFMVTSGCVNTNSGHGAVLQQLVQAVSLSLIRFGVFYTRDLEILPGPAMNFHGPVHSNGDLYLGGPLQFHQRLTSAGQVFHRRKDAPHERPGEARILNASGHMLSMRDGGLIYDSAHGLWTSLALTRWEGQIQTTEHGVSELAPPINPLDDPHDIIQRPLPAGSTGYHENTEAEKLGNKAALRIHVTGSGNLTVTDFHGADQTDRFTNTVALVVTGTNASTGRPLYGKTPNGHYAMSATGSVATTATFYDAREGRTNVAVDIYVDRFQQAFPEIHDGAYLDDHGRGIVYVSRDDPDSGNYEPVVRLRNGSQIVPLAGLTFASDLPVYIEGHYNTNAPKPALVAGDAVTILSRDWQDARSTLAKGSRPAVDTEVRSVIMTGNTETYVGRYNGGLENVLRFLENWSGRTLTYRGSIVVLWYSGIATGLWHGGYYDAPIRNWGYDTMYINQVPPGMTRVFGMEEVRWARVAWSDVAW